jgi:hypothetical protein
MATRKKNPRYGRDAVAVGDIVLVRGSAPDFEPWKARVRGCTVRHDGFILYTVSGKSMMGEPADDKGYALDVTCETLPSWVRVVWSEKLSQSKVY